MMSEFDGANSVAAAAAVVEAIAELDLVDVAEEELLEEVICARLEEANAC